MRYTYVAQMRPLFKKDLLFFLFILLTVILAIFFRTYNYFERVNVHADNAWLLQVARYAFDNGKIPIVGPFSSAGPFFYGPWWFWIFGLLTVFPFGLLTHWYVMTLLSFVLIYLIFWIGREMGGKWLGAIAALFAAISTAQIDNSLAVWSPALIPFLVALSLVFLIKFSKQKRVLDLFLLAFILGLAISIHFQSILLVPELMVALALVHLRGALGRVNAHLGGECYLKYIGVMVFGFIIPFLPLIYWDIKHNWYDTTSLAVYLLVDQYKIWVPNRWLIYVGSYWPTTWSEIIGGSKIVGALIIGLLAIFGVLRLRNFKKYRVFYVVAISFLLEVVMLRYYRGERFYYYSLFAHPPVIVLTAFAVYELFMIQKYLGAILGIVILVLTMKASIAHLKSQEITLGEITAAKGEIYSTYPGKNFDIYGCIYNGVRVSNPLALSMYVDGRNTLDGVKIGACETPNGSVEWHKLETSEYDTSEVGSDSSEVRTVKPAFESVTTERVYRGMEEWFVQKPPGKGNLWQFLRENLHKKV